MNVKIVVDSCSDIPNDVLKKYDIHMVPLNIIINEKEMHDRVDLEPKEYYKIIEKVDLPKTSSPNLAQWKECFDQFLKEEGYDQLVVVTLGHKLSNTYEKACVAAKKFYPDRVRVLNSMRASAGEGLVALKMKELLDRGYDYSTVYSFMEQLRHEVVEIGFMNTLKMLVKTGRVTKAQSFFASLIRLKPLIITEESENRPLGNAISLKNATRKAIRELLVRTEPSMTYSLFITHAEDKVGAEKLKAQIEEKLNISKAFVGYMGPVVGSRVGLRAQILAVIPDKEPQE
ncbi:MAG: DegV family protein [Candidatus Heimdallarchaeaceae archaeon]